VPENVEQIENQHAETPENSDSEPEEIDGVVTEQTNPPISLIDVIPKNPDIGMNESTSKTKKKLNREKV